MRYSRPVAKETGPAGRLNSSLLRLAVTRLSSFWLRSRTTGWIQASIAGVIVPGPPKMLSGTQPGVAAQTAGSPRAMLTLKML
ncbi:hypothetical protein D3C71_1529840 [compost metagenome]